MVVEVTAFGLGVDVGVTDVDVVAIGFEAVEVVEVPGGKFGLMFRDRTGLSSKSLGVKLRPLVSL
jgi:hypothetical protein